VGFGGDEGERLHLVIAGPVRDLDGAAELGRSGSSIPIAQDDTASRNASALRTRLFNRRTFAMRSLL